MIPFGSEVVTLYHKEAGAIERHRLTGCSWRSRRTRTMIDGAAVAGDEITCRYPADQMRACVGDLMVLGDAEDAPKTGMEFAEILERHAGRAFLCEGFSDNTGAAPLPHFCARGSG